MLSLRSRLLLAATVVLAAFLGLTGFALDRAFRDSAEAALRDAMQAQLYGLLAAAELSDTGELLVPDLLPESRFSAGGSGLYGLVVDGDGAVVWRSPSSVGRSIRAKERLAPGARGFGKEFTADGGAVYAFRYGVTWQGVDGNTFDFTITVAEDLERFTTQVDAFRRSMSLWLAAAALVLIAMQGTILRWGLAPLREVADELVAVESGRKSALTGAYPEELTGLTEHLNTFIRNEREHLERHRNTLADLAHSLKTPLAVLRSLSDAEGAKTAPIREQVERMTNIVDYQLRRAATAGKTTLLTPVSVRGVVDKILTTLRKVYADKEVVADIQLADDLQFFGEEGDLYEIFGNLLDNAFKWCRSRVDIRAKAVEEPSQRRAGIDITISDDGPGVPRALLNEVTARGVRAVSDNPGQGIGLAVVHEIVTSYGGALEIGKGDAGGAAFSVVIKPS